MVLIALDTETYEYDQGRMEYTPVLNTQKFVYGCAIEEKKKPLFFNTHTEMYNWINKRIEKAKKNKKRVYIYGHNMEYDWYSIAKGKLMSKNTNYVIFNPFLAIRKEKGYICDTMSFYRMALADIGTILGIEKKEMPTKIMDKTQLKEYLQRDTEIVLKAMQHIRNILSKLGFKPRKMITAGQVAMTCFLSYNRKNYTEKYFTEFNEKLKRREIIKSKYPKLVRMALRGGDNQAYITGKVKNATLIDINGMYADIMRKMNFPDLESERLIENPEEGMFLKYLDNYLGVANVTIKSGKQAHPVLPIWYAEHQNFLKNTEMKGTWTLKEIKQALKDGYKLKKVHWVITYKTLKVNGKKFNPFKKFIEHLYSFEKKCNTQAEKLPIKMIRNNLYGKFAQHKRQKDYKMVKRSEAIDYVEKGYKSVSRYDNKYVMMKLKEPYVASYTNPIISVLITAEGRLRMNMEKRKIPKEAIYYCDTDSLIINDKYTKEYKIGKNLGEWKIEEQKKPCKILGEKRYYIGEQVKLSGIMKKNREKIKIDNEENIKIKKIISLPQALQTGAMEKIGEFREEEREMKPHAKFQIPTPSYINEEEHFVNKLEVLKKS